MAQLPAQLLNPTEKTTIFESYVGTIYAHKEYLNSNTIDEKTGTYNALLRYNIFSDVIEYKNASNLYEITKTPSTHVRIGEDYFYFCQFKNERGFNKEGYYVLTELNDNYRIYKKYDLEITEAKEMDGNHGASQVGKIQIVESYFFEENGIIIELPDNKKELVAVFSDKEEELKEYVKNEKIKPRKQEDLIKFVAKYNALKNLEINQPQSLLSNRGQNN